MLTLSLLKASWSIRLVVIISHLVSDESVFSQQILRLSRVESIIHSFCFHWHKSSHSTHNRIYTQCCVYYFCINKKGSAKRLFSFLHLKADNSGTWANMWIDLGFPKLFTYPYSGQGTIGWGTQIWPILCCHPGNGFLLHVLPQCSPKTSFGSIMPSVYILEQLQQ